MSISNPEHFDYLKVAAYDPNNETNHYHTWYPLNCISRSSAHIKYSDNSEYYLSFDAYDDGSLGFKALGEKARIIAGEQIFEITDFDKSVVGVAKTSVKADQIVNANFKRIWQPRKMDYTSDDGSKQTETVSYVDIVRLISFFKSGIDMMGFDFKLHGHFPQRPMKNVGNFNGKTLLTKIVETWPGTVIVPWGHMIHIYGYQKNRDQNGNLVNIRDIDTGLRFDSMANLRNVKISRKTSTLCNAIEVKSATYEVKSSNSKDDSDDDDVVIRNRPYFPNFLAVSDESIKKYGLYKADSVLDGEFTYKPAAIAAAREKMVTSPVISVTATLDHPGQTEIQPIPGYKYTVGISNEGEAHHVILRGFDWYPFDPTKGANLTLNSIDPGIIANLRTIILHDASLSPELTEFKELEDKADSKDTSDDDDDDDDSGDDTGDDDDDDNTDDDDADLPEEDTDDSDDRPDDNGDGTDDGNPAPGKAKPKNGHDTSKFGVYLPISDKETHAHITRYGNILLNAKNHKWMVRAVDSDKEMAKIRDGRLSPANLKKSHFMDRIFMIDFNQGKWLHGKYANLNSMMRNADVYCSHNVVCGSGLHATQAGQMTLRAKVPNSDWNSDGTIKHLPDHYNKDGVAIYDDTTTKKGNNPGVLARVNMGPLYATSIHQLSKLSTKKNVKKLDENKALDTVMKTDIGEYRYDDDYDDSHSPEASVIIDDVNKSPKWQTPDVFKDKTGQYRNDSSLLAYTVKAVQALQHEVDSLKKENKELKKRLNN